MRRRSAVRAVIGTLSALAILGGNAGAGTLAWDPVTTYTDGTSIGPAVVTYRVFWSTSSALANPREVGSAASGESRTFNENKEKMPKGAIVWFAVKAIAGGDESAYSDAYAWTVPGKRPGSPKNVRSITKEE